MILFWTIIFIVSLFVLVKSSDWLIVSAEKIGLSFGLSPFLVGVTIVGAGTSFPELISSFMAVIKGVSDVVVANAVGSNIANILLVAGASIVVGRKIVISKDSVNFDIPLLFLATLIFFIVAFNGKVNLLESAILLVSYSVYLFFTISQREDDISKRDLDKEVRQEELGLRDFVFLALGIVGLVLSARYLIDALINLSIIFNIGTGVIAITAVALGTSLPELVVSMKAAYQGKTEVAIGNIFGSNVFNLLVVVGLPGLFGTLALDSQTFYIGLPVLALSTMVFILSGVFRKIHLWQGVVYLMIYIAFVAKLFGLF